jgi:hypothetical protein
MRDKKRQAIREQLEKIEERLSNAQKYVAKNVNVRGSSWLHFGDWWGKSGHPLWMKNFMIPTLMKHRARKERASKMIDAKAKDKAVTRRKRGSSN